MPQWVNKKVIAWSLYDFADTAFSALFITFFFPVLIKVHLGGNEFQIGLAMGFSVLAAAILVPLIGAVSDASGKRLPILIIAAFLTAALAVMAGYSGLFLALLFGFLANITHLISKDVYDAKMIEIVPRRLFGSLSGFGVAIGYLGTVASLAIAYPLLEYFGWENVSGIRVMFWEAAVFYMVFSLPLFFLVPDVVQWVKIGFAAALRNGIKEIKQTFTNLDAFPDLGKFLAASFIYNNGMNSVILFLVLFAREEIGLGTQQFFPIFALMALSAGVGSFLFGRLSDKFGPVTMIKAALLVWIAVILGLIFSTSYAAFIAAGVLGGAALGAIWTLNRHMIAATSPERKIAEIFGYEGLTEKFSGVFGPIIFGYLVIASGYTMGLVSVLLFFAIGLGLIWKINPIPAYRRT